MKNVMKGFKVFVLVCLCLTPGLAFANSCSTASLSSIIGTTCSIGDVNFAFEPIGSDNFSGLSASSILFTPDASSLLNPTFSLSGPFSVSAAGVGVSSQEVFSFFWAATVLDPAFQITSATALLVNPVVPASPGFGFINGGNNIGFTNATVQTGGPNLNPSTVATNPGDFFLFPDGYFGTVSVVDGTGNGATTSVDSMEHQYHLTPTPEPPSLLLLGAGMVGLLGLTIKKLNA